MRTAVLLALAVPLLCACPGDGTGLDENGNPIGPPGSEDGITLSGDVQPILTSNCAVANCHAAPDPVLGMNLSAGLSYASIVDVPSQEAPALRRVRPSKPDSSYLVHKIQGTQGDVGGFGGQMPLGRTPLSADEIATIRAWIAAGAIDN